MGQRSYEPSRATAEGQMLAFVGGLTSLRGRRRLLARLACAGFLIAGGAVLTYGAAHAVMGAFG